MKNIFSHALKLTVIAAVLSGNAFAVTPDSQNAKNPATKAATKTDATKAKEAEKKKSPTSADFTPTAEDLKEDTATKTPEEEIKNIQDQRWVEQGAIEQPKAVNTTPGTVTMTRSCTDRNNRSYNPEDAGYHTCMQEVSDSAQEKARTDKKSNLELAPTADPNAPKGNVGLQFKVGN